MFSSAGYFSGSASCCIGMQVQQAQRPKRKGVEIPITILNNAASSSEVLEFVRHAEISEASQAVQAHETDPGHAKEPNVTDAIVDLIADWCMSPCLDGMCWGRLTMPSPVGATVHVTSLWPSMPSQLSTVDCRFAKHVAAIFAVAPPPKPNP